MGPVVTSAGAPMPAVSAPGVVPLMSAAVVAELAGVPMPVVSLAIAPAAVLAGAGAAAVADAGGTFSVASSLLRLQPARPINSAPPTTRAVASGVLRNVGRVFIAALLGARACRHCALS